MHVLSSFPSRQEAAVAYDAAKLWRDLHGGDDGGAWSHVYSASEQSNSHIALADCIHQRHVGMAWGDIVAEQWDSTADWFKDWRVTRWWRVCD